VRQLAVPLHFVLCVAALRLGPAHPWLLAWPALYATILLASAVACAWRERSVAGLWVAPAALVMHAAWAWGFVTGLLRWQQPSWRREGSQPLWADLERDAAAAELEAVVVDPSLFTAPYDGALSRALATAGVHSRWAVRPVRPGDRRELPEAQSDEIFYRKTDRLTGVPQALRALFKGVSHVLGLAALVRRVIATRPDVVHFQWLIVPPLDTLALLVIRRFCPVVVTVHDSLPYNGDRSKRWQALAADLPLRLADRLIVLARSARERLVARGISAEKISVIPHGPMPLPEIPPGRATPRDPRFTFVLFGELKTYKGIDVLVEAMGLLPPVLREQARIIVAGRPLMSLEEIAARIDALGLGANVELRPRRLSELEMAELFGAADCIVFPYRQIDASGVYYQAKSTSKWLIASRLGIFAEDMTEGARGALVPPEDPAALAGALAFAIVNRPVATGSTTDTSWEDIGRSTRAAYRKAAARRRST
jgi:glycosyltransferase involved in cell wall biosynthesis